MSPARDQLALYTLPVYVTRAPVVVTVFISCSSRDSSEHVWLDDVYP